MAEEILILHDRFPAVRDYFASRLVTKRNADVIAKYQRQVAEEFSTSSFSPKGRPSIGRQILRAYKQVAVSNEEVVRLTLFYALAVLAFMRTYGIHEDAYFRTVASAFRDAADLASKHSLGEDLANAFADVVRDALSVSDDFGVELDDVRERYGLSDSG